MSTASSVGLLLGPRFAGIVARADADPAFATVGGLSVPMAVRDVAESAADAAVRVRTVCGNGARALLVLDSAVPVRADWREDGCRFVLVADHLNLTGDNPLVGPNDPDWGPRFPDLTDAWDPELRAVLHGAALRSGIEIQEGVVAGVPGTARTAAEREMLRMLGADMVSSGFVAEAIVGRHAGRRLAGCAVMLPDDGSVPEAAPFEPILGSFISALQAEASA